MEYRVEWGGMAIRVEKNNQKPEKKNSLVWFFFNFPKWVPLSTALGEEKNWIVCWFFCTLVIAGLSICRLGPPPIGEACLNAGGRCIVRFHLLHRLLWLTASLWVLKKYEMHQIFYNYGSCDQFSGGTTSVAREMYMERYTWAKCHHHHHQHHFDYFRCYASHVS